MSAALHLTVYAIPAPWSLVLTVEEPNGMRSAALSCGHHPSHPQPRPALQPARVKGAREAGFNILYGDASRPSVLRAAGINNPRALAVVYTARARVVSAVHSLREEFPDVSPCAVLIQRPSMSHL